MPKVQVQSKVHTSGGFQTEVVGTIDLAFLPLPGQRVVLKAQYPIGQIQPGTKVYGVVSDSPETTHYQVGLDETGGDIDAMIFIDKVLPTGS